MKLYKVTVGPVSVGNTMVEEEVIIDFKELDQGIYEITYRNFSIPVQVEGTEITFHPKRARGEGKKSADIFPMDQDITLDNPKWQRVKSITLDAADVGEGEALLWMFNHETGLYIIVQGLTEPPKKFELDSATLLTRKDE